MNYIGSKYSLLSFLEKSVGDKVPEIFTGSIIMADLFAGTGVVGSRFKALGNRVIANDLQYYSFVMNKHLIANTELGLGKLTFIEDCVKELNNLKGVEGFIYNNYCTSGQYHRQYFSDHNGRKADAMRIKIEEWRSSGHISEDQYIWLLASLLNSIDKVANTASVYGAYLKNIKASALKTLDLALLPIVGGPMGEVYNEDVSLLIKNIEGDVLYLDPPYNSRQYSSNYHVLETIARYDYPELVGVTGMRNNSEQKSRFCSKTQVFDAFKELIEGSKFTHIFISYNNEGLLSLETLGELLSGYGSYSLYTVPYKRFKADKTVNRTHKAESTVEHLHYLKKG